MKIQKNKIDIQNTIKTAGTILTILIGGIGYIYSLKSEIVMIKKDLNDHKEILLDLSKTISEKYSKSDTKRTELKNDIEQDMVKLHNEIKQMFDEYKIRNNQKVDELIKEISKTITKVEVCKNNINSVEKQLNWLKNDKRCS